MSQDGRRQAWNELGGNVGLGYNDSFMAFLGGDGSFTFNDGMRFYLASVLGNTDENPTLADLQRQAAIALGHSTWEEVGYDIKTLQP